MRGIEGGDFVPDGGGVPAGGGDVPIGGGPPGLGAIQVHRIDAFPRSINDRKSV